MSILGQALTGSAGAILGGAVQAGLGIYQMSQGRKDLKAARAEIEQLRANAPSLAVPSAFSDFYSKAMDRSNLDFQMEQIARQQASNTSALSKAGGRALLGGLQTVSDQAYQQQFQATQQQMQREMQASQVYGAAQQQSQQLMENRFRMDLGMADQARQAAQANIQAGMGAVAGAVVSAGGAFADAYSQESKQASELSLMALRNGVK